jgi:hypothetical protein
MFIDLIEFPIVSGRLQWDAREVVQDLFGRPHLLLRIRLVGTHFPHRALEPFLRVGGVVSRFAQISDDGLSVSGYFDRPVENGRPVEFGYGAQVLLRTGRPFSQERAPRLDRGRLPTGVRLFEVEERTPIA